MCEWMCVWRCVGGWDRRLALPLSLSLSVCFRISSWVHREIRPISVPPVWQRIEEARRVDCADWIAPVTRSPRLGRRPWRRRQEERGERRRAGVGIQRLPAASAGDAGCAGRAPTRRQEPGMPTPTVVDCCSSAEALVPGMEDDALAPEGPLGPMERSACQQPCRRWVSGWRQRSQAPDHAACRRGQWCRAPRASCSSRRRERRQGTRGPRR